jgi:DNA-binding transcriptional LysR family regulator
METLANLQSFARSAEFGSFSGAARFLALTPAAVSRNVAMLERNLGVRLFQRSTRNLTLTEAGERFLLSIGNNLDALQQAIDAIATDNDEPAGVLKVSLAPTFGLSHILPLLPSFLARYPLIRPEWHFDNRPVDLIAEGYDAAIGGGFELSQGLIARPLAPAHVIAVASPGYMAGRPLPRTPEDLAALNGIAMRSLATGRIRQWMMSNPEGLALPASLQPTIVLNDPVASREAALLGLGATLLVVPDAQAWIERGQLMRLLPDWYGDAGTISLYYASRTLMPAKTRVFIDYLVQAFEREGYARLFAGSRN